MAKRIMSITRKITFWLISILLLLGTLSAYLIYTYTVDSLIKQTKKGLESSVLSQAHETFHFLRISRELAQVIAKQPRVINYFQPTLKSNTSDPDANYLSSYNIGDMYSSIYVLDKSGTTLFATDSQFIGQNYSFRDYFQDGLHGQPGMSVAVGVTTSDLGYYFSAPIKVEGSTEGVIVLKLKPSALEDIYSANAQAGSTITLVDKYGLVLYSSDNKKNNHSLGPLSSSQLEELLVNRRIEKSKIPQALDYERVSNDLAQMIDDTPTTYDLVDNYDNDHEILTVSKVKDFPLYVISENSITLITGYAYRIAIIVAGLSMLSILTLVIVITIIINKFLSPIKTLNHYAQAIISGKYDETISIQTNDELQELGNVLSQMSHSIKNAHSEIEAKVKARTEELTKMNSLMTDRELKMIELKQEINRLKGGNS